MDIDLPLNPTFIKYSTYTGHTFKWISYLFVYNSIKIGTTFFSCNRHYKYGYHRTAELEDKRIFSSFSNVRLGKIDLFPDVIDCHIQIRTPIEYAVDHGHIVF